jgi:hypothetical protein
MKRNKKKKQIEIIDTQKFNITGKAIPIENPPLS